MAEDESFPDFHRAPNIADHSETYEKENEAIDPAGVLWQAIRDQADWRGQTLVDLGCGTGFWLPRYVDGPGGAARVIGVEPDGELREQARRRTRGMNGIEVAAGSAEHLPFADASVDVVHARFAYFFPPGCEPGLHEVWRVLRRGGALVVIDNDWRNGEFAELLGVSSWARAQGTADSTDAWWQRFDARRVDVLSAWRCRDATELDAVLRIEFPGSVVDSWIRAHPDRNELSYGYTLFTTSPNHIA